MASQGIERRDVIRMISMASLASTFPRLRRWVFALRAQRPGKHRFRSVRQGFQPQFFTIKEFQLIDQLTELIIPADDNPGAHDAGVAEFIDFVVANGADLSRVRDNNNIRDRFRSGLQRMNTRSQLLMCRRRANGITGTFGLQDRFRSGEEDGQKFFRLMRDCIKKGYYTSRVGLELLA